MKTSGAVTFVAVVMAFVMASSLMMSGCASTAGKKGPPGPKAKIAANRNNDNDDEDDSNKDLENKLLKDDRDRLKKALDDALKQRDNALNNQLNQPPPLAVDPGALGAGVADPGTGTGGATPPNPNAPTGPGRGGGDNTGAPPSRSLSARGAASLRSLLSSSLSEGTHGSGPPEGGARRRTTD